MECMGVTSGCGYWVWLVSVVVRRYIDFLILLIPTPLVSVLFVAASLLLFNLKKKFFVLVPVLFVFKFYVLNIFLRSINTHTGDYGHPQKPYEGLHIMFYIRRSTHKQTLHIRAGNRLRSHNRLSVS